MIGAKWVVYNTTSFKNVKEYKSRSAAIKFAEKTECHDYASIEHYIDNIYPKANEMVEVLNVMTNKPTKIRRADLGGVCDPSMESYWSM